MYNKMAKKKHCKCKKPGRKRRVGRPTGSKNKKKSTKKKGQKGGAIVGKAGLMALSKSRLFGRLAVKSLAPVAKAVAPVLISMAADEAIKQITKKKGGGLMLLGKR